MPNILRIALKNDSDLDNLFAYVTGIAIQHDGKRCLLKADGKELYFPENPSAIGSPLLEDCAIPIPSPGVTTYIEIPQIAGGRIWISEGKLTFLLNPGPALVEPSVLNPSDPNAKVNFGFCEFTSNDAQLYANISYVDFVPRIPIAITLQQNSGEIQHVSGMAPDGLDLLAEDLIKQSQVDNRPWDKLIVKSDDRNLRILAPTHSAAVSADFTNYYEPYVASVWQHYSTPNTTFTLNTQAQPGTVTAFIDRTTDLLTIENETFPAPNTADIFGCNSGPFTTGPSATRNAIIPRLAAAFVRSTLLTQTAQPSFADTYYREEPTNHYARLVHERNVDGKGYAFAYDDVQPDGGEDQSGKVNAGDPMLFVVTVGGKSAAKGRGGSAAVPNVSGGSGGSGSGEEGEEDGRSGLRGRLKGFAQKLLP